MLAATISANPTTVEPRAQAVSGAIRQATKATGTSFEYLLATAQVESGFNPPAAARTTLARSLFQFIEQTWLGTLKQSGPALGYAKYANAVTRARSGRYVVSDPALRREILHLRQDPTANAVMAGAFTKANAAYLASKIGRAPRESELYIAHFLGVGGAGKLIALAAQRPQARVAEVFASAARANRSIFYDKRGHARTLAGVVTELTGRFQVARAASAPVAVAALPQPQPVPPAAVPDTAALTSAYAALSPRVPPAAEVGPIFEKLFHAGEQRGPVAPEVSELWRGSPAAAAEAGKPLSLATPARVAAVAAPANATAVRPAHRRNDAVGFDFFREFARNVRALFGT